MIWKIWTKIFFVLLLATIPLMLAQYFLQRESIELVFEVVEKADPPAQLDSHLQLLKKISSLDPRHTEDYKKEFEKTVESKIERGDVTLVRENLVKEILKQTLRNTLVVLGVFLAMSFWISKGIVDLLKRLIQENRTHSLRLEKLGSLESWQRVARMLVHELRAPITPIKLIATDIQGKYASLPPASFNSYLNQGSELIKNQVSAIERLIESFTLFAKLPDVKKSPHSVREFLKSFCESYRDFKPDQVRLTFTEGSLPIDSIAFDTALVNLVFFNLLKNAVEANSTTLIHARLSARQEDGKTWIQFSNTGGTIPTELADKIFDLYVSTKLDHPKSNGSNLGMGLTISRKIALDHGGDLALVKNNDTDGVVFELELPNA